VRGFVTENETASTSGDPAAVIFDPGRRSLLDAGLLGGLCQMGRALALEGRRLRVVCPDFRQRRLLSLAGFGRSFDLVESAGERS
jgi:hypothetical protein